MSHLPHMTSPLQYLYLHVQVITIDTAMKYLSCALCGLQTCPLLSILPFILILPLFDHCCGHFLTGAYLTTLLPLISYIRSLYVEHFCNEKRHICFYASNYSTLVICTWLCYTINKSQPICAQSICTPLGFGLRLTAHLKR